MSRIKTGAWQTCPACGIDFYAAGWEIRKGMRYCSKPCAYQGRVRLPTKTESDRFWPKVDRSGECWIWLGANTGKSGYGIFALTQMPGTPQRRILAHRWTYEQAHGPIPDELEIDHLCRVHACVNPDHLEAVTRQVNILRGTVPFVNGAHNAAKTHCPRGHEYNDANTYRRKDNQGKRQCRACDRERKQEQRTNPAIQVPRIV